MILIADCGSTKTDWCLLDGGEIKKRIFTGGMNAVMLTGEEISGRCGNRHSRHPCAVRTHNP